MRYPLARNLIIMKGALAWLGLWFALAVLGIWLLNPRILAILFAAALLAVACVKLLKVTWWRTMVSGLVKSAGPLAAVFAVVPAPSLTGLGGMLGWLSCGRSADRTSPPTGTTSRRIARSARAPLRRCSACAPPNGWWPRCLPSPWPPSLLLALSPPALGWPFQLAVLLVGVVLLRRRYVWR